VGATSQRLAYQHSFIMPLTTNETLSVFRNYEMIPISSYFGYYGNQTYFKKGLLLCEYICIVLAFITFSARFAPVGTCFIA
jgi:hypothetical protein